MGDDSTHIDCTVSTGDIREAAPDLTTIRAALAVVADREVFASDGALYAYDAERCFRVGGGDDRDETVSVAIAQICEQAPAVCNELDRLRAERMTSSERAQSDRADAAVLFAKQLRDRIATLKDELASTRTAMELAQGAADLRGARIATLEAELVQAKRLGLTAVDIADGAVTLTDGAGVDDNNESPRVKRDLRRIRTALEAKAPQVGTVGGLLATAPVGSIAETGDGVQYCFVTGPRPRPRARVWMDGEWNPWAQTTLIGHYFHEPARLVPADQADADPATRGPIGEG